MKDKMDEEKKRMIHVHVIDLTNDDDDHNETACPSSPSAKRLKVEIPIISPAASDGAPELELVQPLQVPDFGMSAVVESFLESQCPPLLQPEIELPKVNSADSSNLQNDYQKIRNSTTPSSSQTNRAAATGGRLENVSQTPSFIRFKNDRRISKVATTNDTTEIRSKLQNTIAALKYRERGSSDKHESKEQRRKREKRGDSVKPDKTTKKKNCHTAAQNEILDRTYATNPNPTASQMHEISEETGMPVKDVKKWFSLTNKKRLGLNNKTNVPRNGIPVPVQEQGSHPEQVSKLKYVQLDKRTQDEATIKMDIQNIKNCPVAKLRQILNIQWEVKANRIFKLVTNKKLELQKTVRKESRRIRNIASNVSPLSEEQEQEISLWEERFIDKECRKGIDRATVKHNVDECIMPWVTAFVYSKCTLQNGRLLTLETALVDFSKVSNCNADPGLQWKTPALIQFDM